MHLKDLKDKSPKELLSQAEDLGIEDASSLRVQDLIFAIMKKVAEDDEVIYGDGVIEVMQDGFGFLRSSLSNYLASADDIYVSPQQVKRYGLRTGDTVEGEIRAPKENERYFALTKINTINYHITKPDYTMNGVIFTVNIGLDLPFYEAVSVIANPYAPLVLVKNRLDA